MRREKDIYSQKQSFAHRYSPIMLPMVYIMAIWYTMPGLWQGMIIIDWLINVDRMGRKYGLKVNKGRVINRFLVTDNR